MMLAFPERISVGDKVYTRCPFKGVRCSSVGRNIDMLAYVEEATTRDKFVVAVLPAGASASCAKIEQWKHEMKCRDAVPNLIAPLHIFELTLEGENSTRHAALCPYGGSDMLDTTNLLNFAHACVEVRRNLAVNLFAFLQAHALHCKLAGCMQFLSDLKPENILFHGRLENPTMRDFSIVDFGVSQTPMMSPGYMHPSRKYGDSALEDEHVLYAICIIYFVVLFGFPPPYDHSKEWLALDERRAHMTNPFDAHILSFYDCILKRATS